MNNSYESHKSSNVKFHFAIARNTLTIHHITNTAEEISKPEKQSNIH